MAAQKTILIIEDEKPMARALDLKLSSAGFHTVVAADGRAALAHLSDGLHIDLILLDLVLPEMDGFAFLAERKKQKNKTPVIVLSNLGQDEDIKRAATFGAKDYFVKSNTSLAAIVDLVKKALGL